MSEAVKKRRRQRAELRKDNRLDKDSRQMFRVAYLFIAVFVLMVVYLGYFTVVKSEDTVNNSYNVRLQDKEKNVYRGAILASGGEVLAETVLDENGDAVRRYPYGSVFAHAIGYSTIGTTGVEKMANRYLLSPDNSNLLQDLYNEWTGNKFMGSTVVTTLDAGLQQVAYEQLAASGYQGAVVALEPSTGKVLAMVSLPDYDPNTIASIWEDLVNSGSGDSRLVNRATQGLYPPGSTFKVLTALEFLRENPDYDDRDLFECDGAVEYGDSVIQCSGGAVHGIESLRSALANSCNGFFAVIGSGLNTDKFMGLCDSFLFNQKMPYAMEYKKSSFTLQDSDGDWIKMQTMFGQGQTLITPMHMAMIAATIANGGTMMTPYMIDRVQDSNGLVQEKMLPESCASPMTAAEAERLTSYMISVVNEGTGYLTQSADYQSACKTGSAEYDSSGNTHAWYMGFAPADNPQIAVAVLLEKGGSGGAVAGPIAKAIYDAYLLR